MKKVWAIKTPRGRIREDRMENSRQWCIQHFVLSSLHDRRGVSTYKYWEQHFIPLGWTCVKVEIREVES